METAQGIGKPRRNDGLPSKYIFGFALTSMHATVNPRQDRD